MSSPEVSPWDQVIAGAADGDLAALIRAAMDERPANDTPAEAPQIPGYRILGRLGEGGMGVVWRAQQVSTRRTVALKVVQGARLRSRRARERFEREAELTAQLEHANIARLYDSGAHEGIQYFAMELIDGVPLDRYAEEHALSLRQRVNMLQVVCAAVAHAHQRGIIHRDLKPSNILVTADGQPHVLDFGLAKALGDGGGGGPIADAYATAELAGTPAFMSPEQAAGRPSVVDTRSDVYALGVILYRLVTGSSPYDVSGSYLDVLKRVAECDVVRPRSADARVDADLEALLLKALARDPERRYATVDALGSDLASYLAGEPLSARPPTLAYFVGKRVRRHWPVVLTAAAMLAVLASVATYAALRVRRERDAALVDRRKANGESVRAKASERRMQLQLARTQVEHGDAQFAAAQYGEARVSYGQGQSLLRELGEPTLAAEVGAWDAECHGEAPALEFRDPSAPGRVDFCAWADGGHAVVTLARDSILRRFNVATGACVQRFGPYEPRLQCVAFSRDGGRMLGGQGDGMTLVVDTADGRVLSRLGPIRGEVTAVAWLPDGRRAATGGEDGTVTLWDATTTARVGVLAGAHHDSCTAIAFSTGVLALTGSRNGDVVSWDLATGKAIGNPAKRNAAITALAPMPDGADGFFFAAGDGPVGWHRITDGHPIYAYEGHQGWVSDVIAAPAPDVPGRHYPTAGISCGQDRVLKLWDALSGTTLRSFCGSTAWARSPVLSPDGTRLLATGDDGVARVWDIGANQLIPSFPRGVISVALAAGGRTMVGGLENGWVQLVDVESKVRLCAWNTWVDRINALCVLPDGDRVLVAGLLGSGLWQLSTGRKLADVHLAGVTAAAVSDDGTRCALAQADGHVFLRDASAPDRPLKDWRGHEGRVYRLRFTPGLGLLSAGEDGRVILWSDDGDGKPVCSYEGLGGQAMTATASPDGRWVAAGGGRLCLWDARTGKLLDTSTAHTREVTDVRFTSDGRWLLSTSNDATVRLWEVSDAGTLREARAIHEHIWGINALDTSADGRLAVSAGVDCTLRVWDFHRPQRRRAAHERLLQERDASGGAQTPQLFAALGQWYRHQHSFALALEAFDAAAKAGGSELITHADRGQVLMGLGRRLEAVEEYRHALAADEGPTAYVLQCAGAAASNDPSSVVPTKE
jgi:WD40 repeat protein/predicted Ser/Thr protein kinase